MRIGVNILAQTVHDRARMVDWLARAKPDVCVVCDEVEVAQRVKAASPATTVIHRWVYDGDDSIARMTPGEWAAWFLPALPTGIVGYCLNEPNGDWRAISAYLVHVMSIAGAQNKPLVVGNFSKGNPPIAAIEAGELDALLLAFNNWPLHRLGYHPYFTNGPGDDHANWHVHLLNRAARIGARLRLVATEAGRDAHGGYADGYRAHMDSATYADKLARQADTLARRGIGMAVFCYGEGGEITLETGEKAGKWRNFDLQDDTALQAAIVAYNGLDGPQEDDMAGPPGWKRVTTNAPGVNVNVRSGAGLRFAPLATIKTGDWVKPAGATTQADGYTWQAVTLEDCRRGWVALNVITLS